MKGHESVLFIKKAHKEVDQAFLEKALKENPTCGGCALTVFEKEPMLFLDTTSAPDLGFVQSLQSEKNFKDSTILFSLSKYPDGWLKEDHQPFTLLFDVKNQPLLVAFLEGNFGKYGEQESSHSAEYFAVQKYLRPKIEQMFRLSGQDIKKLCAELNSDLAAQEMASMFQDRGTVALLATTGDIIVASTNPDEAEFTWGQTTKTFGYTEAMPKIEIEKPREMTREEKIAAIRARSQGGAAPATPSTPSAPAETKPVETEPERKSNIPNLESDKDGYLSSEALMYKFNLPAPAAGNKWAAPPLNSNNSTKKAWYTSKSPTGNLTKGWKDGMPMQVPLTAIHSAMDKAKEAKATDTAIPKSSVPAVAPPAPAEKKDIPDDVKNPNGPTVEGEPIPIMPPKLKQHLIDNYLKRPHIKAILDADGEEILDPKNHQDIEKKYPNVINELGLKSWDQLYRLPYPDIYHIAKNYPNLSALLTFWALHRCRGFELKQLALVTVHKDTESKNIPTPPKAADEAPPAPRKSAFGSHR